MANKNRPALRFKGFEEEWEEKMLGEIAFVKTGFPFDSKLFDNKGKYLVITNGNIQDFSSYVDNTVGNRINIFDSILDEYKLNVDDILVTMDGTVGRTAKVKNDLQILAQRVGRLVAKDDSEFLYQLLNTGKFSQQMIVISHGGTIKHISLSQISNYQALIPQLPEQTQIGTYFKNLDALIALQEEKLEKLQNLKKAMLEKMFPAANADVPEIRFKGFTDKWEKKKLGEVGTVAMNKRIFKHQTSEKGEIPFYKIGTFGSNADAFISRKIFEEYKNKYPYPEKGDILISASGSIGKIVEYLGLDEYFQDSNIVWLKHDNSVLNVFLKHFYSVIKWNGLEGSTIKRLYNSNILTTTIYLPSLPEQQKIGNYFQNLDQAIAQSGQKITQLKNLKQALLQKMFV